MRLRHACSERTKQSSQDYMEAVAQQCATGFLIFAKHGMLVMSHSFSCDHLLCDRCEKDVFLDSSIRQCDFQSQENKKLCVRMPLKWGQYCEYEVSFVSERWIDLLQVFGKLMLSEYGRSEGRAQKYDINHGTLWYICFIYANDLKPVRQFHDIEGGCDSNRRAAFLARLISKHKPIEMKASPKTIGDESTESMMARLHDPAQRINELYAVQVLLHFIHIRPEAFANRGGIAKKILEDLLFIFTHRDPQLETLVSIARLLRQFSDDPDAPPLVVASGPGGGSSTPAAGSDGEMYSDPNSVTHGLPRSLGNVDA